MKQFLTSVAIGTSITFIPATVAAFLLGHIDANSIFVYWLYGPLMLMEHLGVRFDCLNANSVSEKLNCIRSGLIIDLVVYWLVITCTSVMVHFILFRREKSQLVDYK